MLEMMNAPWFVLFSKCSAHVHRKDCSMESEANDGAIKLEKLQRVELQLVLRHIKSEVLRDICRSRPPSARGRTRATKASAAAPGLTLSAEHPLYGRVVESADSHSTSAAPTRSSLSKWTGTNPRSAT